MCDDPTRSLRLNCRGQWELALSTPPRVGEYRIFRGALWRWLDGEWVWQADAR
jgi:hypothetical protein